MAFARVFSAQPTGLAANIVHVEVDLSRGLHSFTIVGLPDKAVEESRDRVGSAVKNSGLSSPKHSNKKVVVSLAPADLRKEGPLFDLSIALAYLLAEKEVSFDPKEKLFLGELSLNGDLRPVSGVLPLVQKAQLEGFKEIYVPKENAEEAALIKNIKVFGVDTLKNLVAHFSVKDAYNIEPEQPTKIKKHRGAKPEIDFRDIKGQGTAKRALEIAASGGHNVALFGPPGTGKTMLAKAFAHILPSLTFDEVLESTGIHSIVGQLKEKLIVTPPFRAPHHTSSYVSIVGGGTIPKPGEVTLAHNGVLFLDEFPEFDRRVVESLRQPLEEGTVSISRAKGSEKFLANFILIAAMNPCPCGNYGSERKACTCTPSSLDRYKRKLSGPLVDRIDMWVHVANVDHNILLEPSSTDTSETEEIRNRVEKARALQKDRSVKQKTSAKINSSLTSRDIEKTIHLSTSTKELLSKSAERLGLSARAYHRVLKVARTIADLENSENIEEPHILEALQYRPKEQIFQ